MTEQDRAKLLLLIDGQVKTRVQLLLRVKRGTMSKQSYDVSIDRFNRKIQDFLNDTKCAKTTTSPACES